MRQPSWPRLLVCGLITGGLYTLLSTVALTAVGGQLIAVVTGDRQLPPAAHLTLFVVSVATGVWALWLYAAIRARYGPGTRAALVAAVAWWVIAALQSAKWMAALGVPANPLLPLAGSLAAAVAAVLVGAQLYERSS